jgi:Sulfatase
VSLKAMLGRGDVLLLTLDTLRHDVAAAAWADGTTPNLAAVLPRTGWELRHTPGTFTYAAHAAFFAGFLPTPAGPGPHPRPVALRFPGSETTTAETAVLDAETIVAGLANLGYHTICIGGVGFFNKQTPLGSVLPSLFAESHWSPRLGVTDPQSSANQIRLAVNRLREIDAGRRVFLFINIAALHQPNCHYLAGATEDGLATHRAALEQVDRDLAPLFAALAARGPGFGIVTSDHGTAYGEDGYHGHRLAHPVVWNVPYAEFEWEGPA